MEVETGEEDMCINFSMLDIDYLFVFVVEYGDESTDKNTRYDNITYGAGVIIDILIE